MDAIGFEFSRNLLEYGLRQAKSDLDITALALMIIELTQSAQSDLVWEVAERDLLKALIVREIKTNKEPSLKNIRKLVASDDVETILKDEEVWKDLQKLSPDEHFPAMVNAGVAERMMAFEY